MSTLNHQALRRRGQPAAALIALCAAAAACGAPTATSATAAGDWATTTTPIPTGIPASTGPALLADGGHGVIATWEAQGKRSDDPIRAGSLALGTMRGSEQMRVPFGAPRPLRGGGVVQLEANKAATWSRSHLALRWLDGANATTRTVTLGSTGEVLDADLAIAEDGRVLVGWVDWPSAKQSREAAPRVAAHVAFLAPSMKRPAVRTVLATHDANGAYDRIAVALEGQQGLAAIATSASHGQRIVAAVGPARAIPSRTKLVARERWTVEALDAALVGGRPVIAWGELHHGEEAESPWRIHASVGPTNAFSFGKPRVLDTGTDRAFPPTYNLQIGVRPDRTAALAWSQAGPDGNGIMGEGPGSTRAAFLKGPTFSAPTTVTAGAFGGLAVRADGGPIALSGVVRDAPTSSSLGQPRITTAIAPTGKRVFEPGAPIATGLGDDGYLDPPFPTFDAGGRPVVGWINAPKGRAALLSVATGPLLP